MIFEKYMIGYPVFMFLNKCRCVICHSKKHFYCLGCVIVGGAQEGIHFTFSRDGRPSGECFVEFATGEDFNR